MHFFYGKDKANERALRGGGDHSPDGKSLPPPTTPCSTRGATGALPA